VEGQKFNLSRPNSEQTVSLNSLSDNRTIWYVLSICLVVYIFSAKGHTEVADTVFSYKTAQAIVTRGQLDIPHEPPNTLTAPDGRDYSKYGFGLPLYYLPFAAAAQSLSRFTALPFKVAVEFLISFANIPFALLALLIFGKLLRLFGVTEAGAALLVLGLGLGTLAWRYAVYDFSEAMQMALLLAAVYAVIRGTPRTLAIGGLAFAWLFLVKLIYAAFFPVLLAYLLTRPGNLRQRMQRAALFMFPFVLAGCFACWLNFIRFGNPLESGYGTDATNFIPSQIWYTLPRLLGSLDKGLLVFCPILLLGLNGWREFVRRHQPEATLCAALILENLLLIAAYYWWKGDWSWGPRYLVPFIPLWLLPSAFVYLRWWSRKRLWVFALVTAISTVAQIPGILVSEMELHDVKLVVLTPQERPFAPSDFTAAWIFLKHKLVVRNEVYRLSEFDVPGERELNLTPHRSFLGLDLWTELIAREFKKPALRWLPLVGAVAIGCLAVPLGKTFKTELAGAGVARPRPAPC